MNIPNNIELSDGQKRIMAALSMRSDVEIGYLYSCMQGIREESSLDRREQQQRLGSEISKMNVKLAGHKLEIKPGKARGTYRVFVR